MRQEFGPEANTIIDQFLRDLTRLKIGVFGMVWTGPEAAAVMVLRNRNSDPVTQAKSMLSIIEGAAQDKRIIDSPIAELN